MPITFAPLLSAQRDVYRIPFGVDRFRAYLRTIMNENRDDVAIPPLVAINPMARDHVPNLLDEYLALRADELAADALEETVANLRAIAGDYTISLVAIDDLKGGWTNRYAYEYNFRRTHKERAGKAFVDRAHWLVAPLWSSEPASLERALRAVAVAAFRLEHSLAIGPARTVAEILRQEGYALARSTVATPNFDLEEIEYTRSVICAYGDRDDMATVVACLFGDSAARTLGFAPLGLSPKAGLALAHHDACAQAIDMIPARAAKGPRGEGAITSDY